MNNATPFLEGVIADYIIANGGYVSLHTGNPTSGNEVSTVGTGYTRKAIAYTKTGSEPTSLTNSAVIEFPLATGDWGLVTHAAIMSTGAGAGNMLVRFPLTVAKSITAGDVARFMAGELDIDTN